tara:strand:- start:60116 stop:61216 length:1101 start_codon:yes stop_codon:yes gene_type:complete
MMTYRRLPALAACLVMLCSLLPVLSSAKAQTVRPPDVVRNAVTQFIIPAHQEFNAAATQLANTMEGLCATPTTRQLQQARNDFDAIILAWSSISIIRIGPILEDNRLERLLFWPDRRGIGLRQVQALLVSKDPTALEPESLAKKSVATQGLAALEFVLLGAGAETLAQETQSFRCGYGRAISANINRISKDILTEWQAKEGFAAQWQNPDPDHLHFRDSSEALSTLVSLFANGLAYYDTVEMAAFFGETPDNDRSRQALFRRSDNTLSLLQAGFSGFERFYKVSNLASLLPEGSGWIDDAIGFGFHHGGAALDRLSGPIADILADPPQRSKLAYVRTVVRGLGDNFGMDMTGALGLTSNFSSLDGD